MSRRDGHAIGRFVLSLVSFAAIAVGLPAGWIAISTVRFGSANPLAGVRGGSAASLTEPIADQTVADALVRVSLCVAWVAVAVIVATTVLEVVHMTRHRGLSMPDVRGVGWAQRIARFIAVGLVVVIPLTASAPTIAATMARAPAGATAHTSPALSGSGPDITTISPSGTPPSESSPSESATPIAEPTSHVVQPGESVYSIAEGLARGDAARVIEIAEAIVDANLGASMGHGQRFTNPAYIEIGWVLHIPSRLVPTTPMSAPLPTPDEPSGHTDQATIHRVQPGDTLWDIADERLGDPNAWPTIWEANRGASMDDGRTFDDPNLILPGWTLQLDSPDAATVDVRGSEPGIASDAQPAAVDDTPATAEPVEEDTVPDGTVDAVAEATVEPAPVDTVTASEPPPAWSSAIESTTTSDTSTTTTTAAPIDVGDGVPDHGGAEAPGAPSPIRLEHAALLAAGILALVAVRRRQRLRAAMPRHRVPEPRTDVIETERRLRSIDAGERALRTDVAIRAAAAHLVDTAARIGWVEVSHHGDVDLRLTAPALLESPWSGAEQNWHLGAEVPIELLSDDARRVDMPCVALVQVGVTAAGGEVLVDLEACGILAVDARPDQADDVTRAIAAGLASSMYAEVAHLIVAAMPATALLGHRNAHTAASTAEALELARSLVGTTIDSDRSTFELRSLRTGGEMWEPALVVLDSADDPPTDAFVAGHGIAVVTSVAHGELADAPTRLIARSDGWVFEGFGSTLELTPIGLSTDELAAIGDVLADAERELESIELASVEELEWAELTPVDQFVPMEHRVVVGLLGAIAVTDSAGAPGSFERSKTVELIAWLATHRERSTRTGARTALWELDVRDATFANVVSEARRGLARLVPPPDGEEWVARTLTEQLPLHQAVVTDADLVTERLESARVQPPAQALDTLRPAVAMIRDMPFAGTSYLWPDAEGITSNLVLLAITAASEFAGHALSLGDTDGVFWATGQGLKVLPGHEELIGLRMRSHARAGDLAGVRQEWESYERILVADAWSDGEPAPKLLALRRDLLASNAD